MIDSARPVEPGSHGERRRRAILDSALDVASAEGLDGLSIGRLAAETGLSKSGLFAHFGSKERLQLAAIDAAAAEFERAVARPPLEAEGGIERLRAMLEAWIGYVEETRFRGGCFFFATSAEYGSRPGPVRERLAEVTGAWLRALEREARTARRLGELPPRADPRTLAFRLHAYVQEANWTRELFDDDDAFDRARAAIAELLGGGSRRSGRRHPRRRGARAKP